MRIQIAKNELFIELDEKDLVNLSQKYLIKDKFKFSILDDESLLISLRMEGSDKLCTMYDSNELIIFLPFNEFEKWLNSDNTIYHSSKGNNASNNMHITLKKNTVTPKVKAIKIANESTLDNNNFIYN
ncbi:DUF7009 family protein [Portibacter lacus]|uniref:Uncharacterized protein n=1 Tax=Portibacter lacus TaxID=1099794 RepID=A0AA37WHX5_9BACT|nr:hypothetical protein [Portibacter lacus]GLR20144.1 hypothetical protein GCM10007940_47600 [Portibacter lacus]